MRSGVAPGVRTRVGRRAGTRRGFASDGVISMVGRVLPRRPCADGTDEGPPRPVRRTSPRQANRQKERLMTGRSVHHVRPAETPAPAGPRVPSRDLLRLPPSAGFPADLAELTVRELQVLHSRLSRQLNHEHLGGSAGPHPESLARFRRVVLALDMRAGVDEPVRPLPR